MTFIKEVQAMKTILLVASLFGVVAPALAGAAEENPPASSNQPVALFNGKDFTGWKRFVASKKADVDTIWQMRDGVLHCTGRIPGYIRTTAPYRNYKIEFDWRWPDKPGNSGLLIHIQEPDMVWPKSIECQLMNKNAGDFYVIEGSEFKEHTDPTDRRVAKRHDSNEKPPGEWNHCEAVCDGNTITVTINGRVQNVATETNITTGYIGLQSEGASIEFRNVTLTPLKQ